ncbi:Tyrosine recombinase XerC (plasmid) [Aquisphaera giovannonii]|uniref:Tyrosine recombinase XerC n=1 Tax=Aquisphaera giovannonii TaxID=406548 RepID=A0A5B9WGX8_9BACT|nr:tyrosine-type recombinase/integrase [Aquisphaera giovannonii]QEH39245.1 Tyrosine recombinase XerC [Aquisphaera giovannonii]
MPDELVRVRASRVPVAGPGLPLPSLVERAGAAARFAWDEFFYAEHHNPHTQKAYQRAVRRFLAWCEGQGEDLAAITPGQVGRYLTGLGGSAAKRNVALAALRGFFDRLVNRHVCVLNPAASVKGARDVAVEGRTPEIGVEQARMLLASVDVSHVVGLRDRAVLATLAYTACRAGAVARLRLRDFQHDGTQYVLRFLEKGGKGREIPVRHDLEGYIRAYLDAAALGGDAGDSPLFRASNGRTKRLTAGPLSSKRICELVKRRLKDAGLPSRISPHSFRVTAITDLLTQGVPLEDVQYLAGHAEPRTTGLYDRRRKGVTRNIVERISI